jgi:hypothetical protein
MRVILAASAIIGLCIVIGLCFITRSAEPHRRTLHYAPNLNFDDKGDFLPGSAGFNVADVSNVYRLRTLPDGVQALIWVGQCDGLSDRFRVTVKPFLGDPKVFGFFLMDDPDPRTWLVARRAARCRIKHLKEESDWLHQQMPGTRTMITLMNLGNAKNPSFINGYNPVNSHIDLFALSAYPCRTEWNGCDYDVIKRYVTAGERAGIPRDQMIPVYQAFGGGVWKDDEGGKYVLPTQDEASKIISGWHTLVPAPLLDMAYSWGRQQADISLQDAPNLKRIFLDYNRRP